MPRRGDHLFQRTPRGNWYVCLYYPTWLRERMGRRKIEIPLRTRDRNLAEVLSLSIIRDFKIRMMVLRAERDGSIVQTRGCKYPDGTCGVSPQGERFTAVMGHIHYFDAAGQLLRSEPNFEERFEVTSVEAEEYDFEHLFKKDLRQPSFPTGEPETTASSPRLNFCRMTDRRARRGQSLRLSLFQTTMTCTSNAGPERLSATTSC